MEAITIEEAVAILTRKATVQEDPKAYLSKPVKPVLTCMVCGHLLKNRAGEPVREHDVCLDEEQTHVAVLVNIESAVMDESRRIKAVHLE